MLKRIRYLSFYILTVALSLPFLNAQQPNNTTVAPVPTQILSAKKVFISNAGIDSTALDVFVRLAEPNKPYNQFYAAMKNWGRYELVDSPADADLVFEIRFGAPLIGANHMDSYAPQYNVTILDTKTHFTLWALSEPVEGAFRKNTFIKNLDQAMGRVMSDLKKLADQPAAISNAQK